MLAIVTITMASIEIITTQHKTEISKQWKEERKKKMAGKILKTQQRIMLQSTKQNSKTIKPYRNRRYSVFVCGCLSCVYPSVLHHLLLRLSCVAEWVTVEWQRLMMACITVRLLQSHNFFVSKGWRHFDSTQQQQQQPHQNGALDWNDHLLQIAHSARFGADVRVFFISDLQLLAKSDFPFT